MDKEIILEIVAMVIAFSVVISAALIFTANTWLLSLEGIQRSERNRVAFFMALITAPWLFFASI